MNENAAAQQKTSSQQENWATKTDHSEGVVAESIEQQTAKLPSDLFLWGAAGSIGVSLILRLSGDKERSRFVGQWVAPILLLGVYNKIVKVAGSDKTNGRSAGNLG